MKTVSVKQSDIKKRWLLVDAKDQAVGRLATEIARVLRGKHKPNFVPHLDNGDYVVVVNADKIKLTGNKLEDKYYYSHSGFPGGFKSVKASEVMKSHPDRVLYHAVKGMLPHNALCHNIINNLKIYSGSEHPHVAQKPVPMPSRIAKGDK